MNPHLAYYVVRYYSTFMTESEHRANLHLIGTLKATMGRDDVAAQEEEKCREIFCRMLSDEPEILELSRNGMQAFTARAAARILEDHGDDVFLNFCPRCRELARTPTAKQCRFCGFDWHSASRTRED
jgi:hypothetical protein